MSDEESIALFLKGSPYSCEDFIDPFEGVYTQ